MTLARLGILAVVVAALPANPCEKPKPIVPPQAEPPPPTPPPSSTRPPVWAPVDTGPPPKAEPPSDLVRAQSALEAKDYKKVKGILEAKVKAGRGTSEERDVLQNACALLKDKACLAMIKKAGFVGSPAQP